MIIQNVTVEADLATLRMSPHGSITGIVVIRVDGACFPEARWNDFPVVILGWWLEPIPRILTGASQEWDCLFMDGPVAARLEQHRDDLWNLRCLLNGHVELTATISCCAFIRSLLDTTHQLLHECKRQGWQSRDIDILGSLARRASQDSV